MTGKTVTVLLVDDDDVDVMALQRMFKKQKIANPVRVASDGREALDILRGDNGAEQIARPYLILLDLNMPRMNGIELLDEIRSDPTLASSLVFVLTTSQDETDRWKAYKRNVAGYLVKSNPADGFINAVQMLDHYWRVIEFP